MFCTERLHGDVRGWRGKGLSDRVLHVELNVLQLLETQPFTVDRNTKIAEVNSILRPRHFLFHGVIAALDYFLDFHE